LIACFRFCFALWHIKHPIHKSAFSFVKCCNSLSVASVDCSNIEDCDNRVKTRI
jgi:hypothetical protein